MWPKPGTSQARNAARRGSFKLISTSGVVPVPSTVNVLAIAVLEGDFSKGFRQARQLAGVPYSRSPGDLFQASFARPSAAERHATERTSSPDRRYWRENCGHSAPCLLRFRFADFAEIFGQL